MHDVPDRSVVVAGVDCGTNSIRLKVSRVGTAGVQDIVPRVLRVIRLGEGVDTTHRFLPQALDRAYAAAREFRQILDGHRISSLRFVATSATRDAANRGEFEDGIERILGVRPEVISGTEEARLSFLGATSVVAPDLSAPYLVVDLGGGSTELVLGGDGAHAPADSVQASYSMNIGSVRMTERHLHSDPPTDDEIGVASRDVDAHISEAFGTVPAGRARTVIGVSGTVTTMAALVLGLRQYDHRAINGVSIPVDAVMRVDEDILRMPRARRAEFTTIHPGRIDVVGGGALIWSHVLQRVSQAAVRDHGTPIDSFISSDHGLLDGIVLDLGRRMLADHMSVS